MATFRGTVQGQRGEASRLGSAKSGLSTLAASWQGAVQVRLWEGPSGVVMAEVELTPHFGHGTRRTLYRGPVADAAKASNVYEKGAVA